MTTLTPAKWIKHARQADAAKTIRDHLPQYVAGNCLCGTKLTNVTDWANHLANELAHNQQGTNHGNH